MKREYRIKEYIGLYWVQVKVERETGFLWWKKTVTEWRNACAWGYYSRYLKPMLPFESFEKAKQMIEYFQEGAKYHHVDQKNK